MENLQLVGMLNSVVALVLVAYIPSDKKYSKVARRKRARLAFAKGIR